jgi:hypothetical protein
MNKGFSVLLVSLFVLSAFVGNYLSNHFSQTSLFGFVSNDTASLTLDYPNSVEDLLDDARSIKSTVINVTSLPDLSSWIVIQDYVDFMMLAQGKITYFYQSDYSAIFLIKDNQIHVFLLWASDR